MTEHTASEAVSERPAKRVDPLEGAPFDTPAIPRYAAKRRPLLGMIGNTSGYSAQPMAETK